MEDLPSGGKTAMTDEEISRAALHAIVAAGVDYVLVGGLAVIAHTFPRTTLDVDFVVAVPMTGISTIAKHFPQAFVLNPQPEMEILTGTYRWIVDVDGSTFRVEIFHLADDAHHQELFRRRISLYVPPIKETVWIPKAEDLVIQKLRWARRKDLDDARNILAVQGEAIDYAYVEKWCQTHGTLDRLAELRASIPPGL
jgi:hypothetical protein